MEWFVDQLVDSSIEFTNTVEWFAHSRWLGEHDVRAVSRYITRIYETTAGVPGDAKEIFNGPDPARRQDFYSDDPRVDESTVR